MDQSEVIVKTVKSKMRRSNKPTLKPWPGFQMEKFKSNLFSSCHPRLSQLPTSESSREYAKRQGVKNAAKKFIKVLETLSGFDNLNLSCEIESVQNIARYLDKQNKEWVGKQVGRQKTNGRVAMILLSALEMTKGDRVLKDAIGCFIKEGGELHMKLDRHYGKSVFYDLYIPGVNFCKVRWDAGVADQLKPSAEAFVFGSVFLDRKRKRDPEWGRKHFEKSLRFAHYCGLRDFELSAWEQNCSDDGSREEFC